MSKSPASTKEGFLCFPKVEYCTTCLSIAPPSSGKTHLLLKCLEEWLKMKMFSEYYLVLPAFENEMSGSYDWLADIPNVHIHEKYHDTLGAEIVAKQKKNNDLFKKNKIKVMPRIFFCVDDASSEKNLFDSENIIAIVTKNRHLHIHSWYLMHGLKGIIPPNVRQNIFYVFLYKLKDTFLKQAFIEFCNFPLDFDDYKRDFKPFFKEYIIPKQYGCLLLGGSRDYSPNADTWFPEGNK
jgi:hypothetical protein